MFLKQEMDYRPDNGLLRKVTNVFSSKFNLIKTKISQKEVKESSVSLADGHKKVQSPKANDNDQHEATDN